MTTSQRTPSGGRSVLVVFHEDDIGGATRAILRVVPHLQRLGWRFTFWAPGPGRLQEEIERLGLPVAGERRELRYSMAALRAHPGPLRRLGSVPRYIRAFRSRVKSESPSLVLANTRLTIPETVASRGDGRAVILHVHEIFHAGLRDRLAAQLIRRGADAVITPSAATARPLERLGVGTSVVPYGVDLPTLGPRRPPNGRRLVVGTLGTVSRRKGTDVFLAAARELRRSGAGADLEFRIVGPPAGGTEEGWGRALVERAEREGVRCKAVAEPFAELAEWDVFVLPTREDPFPLAVLEAMAAGLPVVASRVDGVPEQLGDEAGVLVEVDDVRGFSAAIGELVASPARRAELGDAARRRAEETLTLERQAARLSEVFEEAIAARAAGEGSPR